MPRGPKGEKRPADVICAAIIVARITTGDIAEKRVSDSSAATLDRKGGTARAKVISIEKRAEIAKKAAKSRWNRS